MSIYTAKPMVDPLVREQREAQLRAARLESRKPRVLHPKTRIMGIDLQALDQQVAEKSEIARVEMERDMYYQRVANNQARALTQMETMRQLEDRQRAREVDLYRQQQEKEKLRDRMVKDSVSDAYKYEQTSFLKFRGEDVQHRERTQAQKQQQMDWLNQQVTMMQVEEERQRRDQAAFDAQSMQITALRKQMEEEAEAQRRSQARTTVQRNQQLAVEKHAMTERQRRIEEDLAKREIDYQLQSELMVESEGFRGFTAAQRAAILEEQQRQIAALRERKMREAAQEKDFNANAETVRRALVIADRQKMAQRTQRAVGLKMEHERQRKEKELRYDYLDNVVYTNPPRQEYFEQFGQSAR